ncbi:hypothetical protein [Streptomyces sp. HPF1205]|uniref:hypothetical protein n=1 Tax=Streptomyces sp. HPF1205 TaxID=2873262 RepID=UPI001CEC2B5E|nr:hypothetical protein [Streptomyces sp. HPF1205]
MGYIYFLFFSFRRAKRKYLRTVGEDSRALVSTVGAIFGDVVGRDELCESIIHELRSRDDARPQVLMGGVGTGKTAVLVRLAKRLSEKGLVPVPVRLREIHSSSGVDVLDFEESGRKEFGKIVKSRLQSDQDEEKAWRRLRGDREVFVLADGLEEVLIKEGGNEHESSRERDALIRDAVKQAGDNGLPLVIASRPHDPLRGMDASITDLEPLNEDEAARYLLDSSPYRRDEYLLAQIVSTGRLVESPLYLEIARELCACDRIGRIRPEASGENEVLRTAVLELRCRLLTEWMRALMEGAVREDAAIDRDTRLAVIKQIRLLAASGLKRDTLVVSLEGLTEDGLLHQEQRDNAHGTGIDLPMAVTLGSRLGLVEFSESGVRFPHSIVQAYLGAGILGKVMKKEESFSSAAFRNLGREFLLSMVMYANILRMGGGAGCEQLLEGISSDRLTEEEMRYRLGNRLLMWDPVTSGLTETAKILEGCAAFIDIDNVCRSSHLKGLALKLGERWREMSQRERPEEDQRTVEEAKIGLIRRFGEAIREKDDPQRQRFYMNLLAIAAEEHSYPVRLEAATQIGQGASEAVRVIPHRRDIKHRSGEWYATMQAWLSPMLVAGTTPTEAGERVNWYVDRLGAGKQHHDISLPEEVALAQGFKLAANRRVSRAGEASKKFLFDKAVDVLKRTTYWYTHLTVLHALTLWSLRQDIPILEARSMVRGWLTLAGTEAGPPGQPQGGRDGRREHPFVTEAGRLAVMALHLGETQKYLWIDESDVVSKVGSYAPAQSAMRQIQRLWIPSSAGWGVLDPRARMLVADVLVLSTLANRGEEPTRQAGTMARTMRSDIPPCLSGSRDPLRPTSKAMPGSREAGSTCAPGCEFGLCPYPPRAPQSYWPEIHEAFCRKQHDLLDRHQLLNMRQAAWWQGTTLRDLRHFWASMEERAQK